MTPVAAHPFFDSYFQADLLGKSIYLTLITLSVISWSLIIHKSLLTRRLHRQAAQFKTAFKKQKQSPLNFTFKAKETNPFGEIYQVLKKQTYELLNKNHQFSKEAGKTAALSPTDFDFIDTHVSTNIAFQLNKLEKNLYILSTSATLAPFLGILGTVWGVLMSLSHLQGNQMGNANQIILGDLSLALTTTVLGLLVAIPALVGYNYLKNSLKTLQMEMESFSDEVMASLEIQYCRVDVL